MLFGGLWNWSWVKRDLFSDLFFACLERRKSIPYSQEVEAKLRPVKYLWFTFSTKKALVIRIHRPYLLEFTWKKTLETMWLKFNTACSLTSLYLTAHLFCARISIEMKHFRKISVYLYKKIFCLHKISLISVDIAITKIWLQPFVLTQWYSEDRCRVSIITFVFNFVPWLMLKQVGDICSVVFCRWD